MYDATDNPATADEIVAAVRRLQDQRDELLEERDDLRREIVEATAPERTVMHTMDLPNSRGWAFLEDANVLAVAPSLSEEARARLLAQIEPPTLVTCASCGAPVWSGAACQMHDEALTL